MIELRNFSKRYQTGIILRKYHTAVDDFSMICPDGMVTGLLGPNGAGKTTILKAVCGYHFATSGKVFVNDFNVSENPAACKRITGFVEEQPVLPPEYTVYEYLSFTADLFGLCNKEKLNALDRVISDCALNAVIDKKNHSLSKGFRQRVAFAKALVNDPCILVLDEPISGLDPAQIVHMRELIKKLSAGRTVLLSTHLMQEVSALCSKIYIIAQGNSIASGSESDLLVHTETQTIEEAFLKLTAKQVKLEDF